MREREREGWEREEGRGVAVWHGQLNATNRQPLTANDTFMPL